MGLSFKKNILLIVIFCTPFLINSQTIKGKVLNNEGQPILQATIIVKDSIAKDIPKEFAIAKNGEYIINLKKKYATIILETSSNGYVKNTFQLEEINTNKTYIHDIILTKEKSIEIKEVVVETKKKPFLVKKDTVSFNVSAYKDGSERKIQDIIKKLPGIEINESSGEIKYKGKSIETVKLEGDDLFGSNYTLGTKNINVDMVEQIQAIENYSENPLLKEIEGKEKVALNLKLKKGKTDFSGNLDVGNGLFEEKKAAFNNGLNLLAISKKMKTFSTLTHNTIGQNNSPYDYFSYNQTNEQLKEKDLFTKKIIPENIFVSYLNDSRINNNNQYFANYNSIFKIGPKVSIKTNLFYINDKINTTHKDIITNYINNTTSTTIDYFETVKKPTLYKSDIEMKITTSSKSLLEYKLSFFQENIITPSYGIKNESSSFETKLKSNNYFLKNNLLFTQKISKNKAVQTSINYSINFTPQEFVIQRINNNYTPTVDIQDSSFKKKYFHAVTTFLGSYNKSKYSIAIGEQLNTSPFYSLLRNQTSNSFFTISKNELEINQNSTYVSYSHSFILNKFKITPSFKLNHIYQKIKNEDYNSPITKENVTLEPNLSIKFKINDNSAITTSINSIKTPISEEYLYNNKIQISNRITQTNTPILEIQKTLNIGGFYIINNLYKQFQFNLGCNYSENRGNYFSKMYVDNSIIDISNFYLKDKITYLNTNILIEKYIPLFESILRFKTDYSISNYKNVINNSELRNNKTKIIDSEFFIKTAFDIKFNFENSFKIKQSNSSGNNNQDLSNLQINNTFKIIVRPKKNWFVLFLSDYYIPNSTHKADDYLFLDSTLKYITGTKRFEFNLTAKNLLNKRMYTQTQTSDYTVSTTQYNLLARTIIASLTYNF